MMSAVDPQTDTRPDQLLNSGHQASSQSSAQGSPHVAELEAQARLAFNWRNYHSGYLSGEDSDDVLWLDFRNRPSSTSDDFEFGFRRRTASRIPGCPGIGGSSERAAQ